MNIFDIYPYADKQINFILLYITYRTVASPGGRWHPPRDLTQRGTKLGEIKKCINKQELLDHINISIIGYILMSAMAYITRLIRI